MKVPSRSRAGRCGPGFTLTELVIVMVLISILGVMAVGSLRGLSGSRQQVAATRIRTALVYAQEWAMGSNNDTWVVFDTGAESVAVYVEDSLNPGKAGRVALADPLTRGPMTLQFGGEGVALQSVDFGGTTEVQFDQLGVGYDGNGNILNLDGWVKLTGGVQVNVTARTGFVWAG